jgi:transposase
MLDGIRHDRRMTNRCIEYIQSQAVRDSWTRIAEHVGCDEKTVRNVAQEFVDRLNSEYQPTMPLWLGIDETKLAGEMRGIFTDVQNRVPVDIIRGRDPRSVAKWLTVNNARDFVQVVTTDMHRPYLNVINSLLPGVPVVIDKFHVVRMAGNGLDKARIRLGKLAGRKVNLGWKRSKTLLNKAYRNLSEKQRFNLDMWLDNEPDLAQAYWFKEEFYAIYDLPKSEADAALDDWIDRVKHSPVKTDFREILSALKNWREHILAYFDNPITNGYTEALNGVAKVINRQGRGYSFEVIRARVLGMAERKKAAQAKPVVERVVAPDPLTTRPMKEVVEEAMALAREAEGRCQSCGGIFDESELYFRHEGAFPIFDISPETIQIVCGSCNARLHTGAAN